MHAAVDLDEQNEFTGLQQLEPSPIESPVEDEEKNLSDLYPPPPTAPPRASPLGLSGSSGHSSVYYLTRLQKYSSYVFTVYATLHITNTSILPLLTGSVPLAEKYFLLTRPYYQSFPFEPLLITIPLATHVLSGLVLRIHRRNAIAARYGASYVPVSERLAKHLPVWPHISNISKAGYFLVPLVAIHAGVNRLLPYIYEGGSSGVGLGFVSHGFARHPFVAWVGYGALVCVASGHFVWGMAKWNGWMPIGVTNKKAKSRWWLLNGAVAALAGGWMAGGLGIVGRGGLTLGWIGANYDVLYSKIPLVGL